MFLTSLSPFEFAFCLQLPSSAWLLHLAGVNELGHAKPLDRNEVGVVGLMGGFLKGSGVGSEDVGISFCGSAKSNI